MFRGRVILRSVSAGVMCSRSLAVIPSRFSSKKVISDKGLIRSVGGHQGENHRGSMIKPRLIAKGNTPIFSASMCQDDPNSKSLHTSFPLRHASLPYVEVYTDASSGVAATGYCSNDRTWFIHEWTQSVGNSNWMELFAIVLAARMWGPYWRNRNVIFKTDCQSLQGCENFNFNSLQMETLKNKLMDESFQHGFRPQVVLIDERGNIIADRLSQKKTNGFNIQLRIENGIGSELVHDLYATLSTA